MFFSRLKLYGVVALNVLKDCLNKLIDNLEVQDIPVSVKYEEPSLVLDSPILYSGVALWKTLFSWRLSNMLKDELLWVQLFMAI